MFCYSPGSYFFKQARTPATVGANILLFQVNFDAKTSNPNNITRIPHTHTYKVNCIQDACASEFVAMATLLSIVGSDSYSGLEIWRKVCISPSVKLFNKRCGYYWRPTAYFFNPVLHPAFIENLPELENQQVKAL